VGRPPTDQQVQRLIGTLLRVGVIAAASIVLAGGIWYLAAHGGDIPNYGMFRGEPIFLTHIAALFAAVFSGNSAALIQLGLVTLIAVPIARVAISIVAYALERDWLYCLVTTLVLAVLLFSLLGGAIR
jgi:uncharacterized membrane protein